jgi:ABC-type oligopeptide transport system ATPase subunit
MKALLELEHVSKRFVQPLDLAGKIARALGADVSDEVVHAVDDVSFNVHEGEVVGLVGESGCGKSTLGRMVAGILPPSAGALRYRGRERIGLQVQMIFQDPFASLNPRMRVEDIVGEAPVVHGLVKKEALGDYLDQLFARCGLDPSYKKRFPHQFSGGQRSRIGIARALAVKPEFLVCDEAVAALDVSIQAQILNLFMKLREDLALTYLFISHDLGVVEHLSDRVVIMYLGRVVESASAEEIFSKANHPYTQALLKQVPRL